MDTKTLSTIIGHVSASTTLDIYAHVTDEMRRTAAVKIDRGISKTEPQKTTDSATPRKPAPSTFQPYKGQRRKPGTGCVSQVNDKLWEGRYSPIWPDGKKHPRNVYAHSKEECERLLAEMIQEVTPPSLFHPIYILGFRPPMRFLQLRDSSLEEQSLHSC